MTSLSRRAATIPTLTWVLSGALLTGCSAAEFSTDGEQAAAEAASSEDAVPAVDGGATDADAAATDAAATDAGATDAGAADAGATDTGATDADDGTPTDGEGDDGDDGDAVDPNSPEGLKAACSGSGRKTHTQHVVFADPGVQCDWSKNGNLGQIDRKVQARTEQSVVLALPANAVLCSLELTAADQPMHYDDQIVLALNDVILWTSHEFAPHLPRRDGFLVYDWPAIRGTSFDPQAYLPYCAGAADHRGQCSMPASEHSGTIKQSFDDDLVMELAHVAGMRLAKDGAVKGKAAALNFVTIGDNDPTDCRHKKLELDVAATYVVAK
jgi:hypothetical protein